MEKQKTVLLKVKGRFLTKQGQMTWEWVRRKATIKRD